MTFPTQGRTISFRSPSLLAGTVLATAFATLAPVTAASADHDVTPARVAGDDRIDTAADVAELQYDTGTDRALLTRDDDHPDALASAALAAEYDAPVLLTDTETLSDRTEAALRNLGVSTVTILGGTDAVSQDVQTELESKDYTVDRIAGEGRYETAANIASTVQDANDNGANFPGDVRAAFVASGETFADALAAGPLASAPPTPIPTVLTASDALPTATSTFLEEYDIENVFIVGGPAAVSNDVADELDDDDTSVQRIAGPDRAWTAAEVANFGQLYLELDPSQLVVARGDFWSDALAAGPFAGASASPIVLSGIAGQPDGGIPYASGDWAEDACGDVDVVRAVGGTNAVTEAELEEFEVTAEDCHDRSDNAQGYVVAPQEVREVSAGDTVQFRIQGHFDSSAVTTPLDVALFPCRDVGQVEGAGYPQFSDRNTDNLADGIADSDTSSARIVSVEGEVLAQPDTHVRDVTDGSDDDEFITVEVRSDQADCTIFTTWDDANDNSAFDLDPSDDAAEPYGVGKATWS